MTKTSSTETASKNGSPIPTVNLGKDVHDWAEPIPSADFDRKASFEIAKYVLNLFGGVYFLAGVITILSIFYIDDMKKDDIIDLVKFFLGSIVPLVTLAVGYYLGDKSSTTI